MVFQKFEQMMILQELEFVELEVAQNFFEGSFNNIILCPFSY